MLFTDQLLAVARAYAEAEAVDLSVVSSRVFDDSKKLPAIASGAASLTLRRAEGALDWFHRHWPALAMWPASVPIPPSAAPLSAGTSAGACSASPAASCATGEAA